MSISPNDLGFSLEEIEYIVAHKGLFQRAPLKEHEDKFDHPSLWRAVLDRALLDYIKGPDQIGEVIFSEVSVWLHDKEDTEDFKTVCDLAVLSEEDVANLFHSFRYIPIGDPNA